jgi:hypothetical protein
MIDLTHVIINHITCGNMWLMLIMVLLVQVHIGTKRFHVFSHIVYYD